MRTAKRIVVNKHLDLPPLTAVQVERLIVSLDELIDEAIAHGMTLSADITDGETYAVWPVRTVEETAHDTACLDVKTAILTARDNKVWRNGGKMSD